MTLARFETHDIFNQSPPYEDVDLFGSDPAVDARADQEVGAVAFAKALGFPFVRRAGGQRSSCAVEKRANRVQSIDGGVRSHVDWRERTRHQRDDAEDRFAERQRREVFEPTHDQDHAGEQANE